MEIVAKEYTGDLLRYNAHMLEEGGSMPEPLPAPGDPSEHEPIDGSDPAPWKGWRKRLDEGAPEAQRCVDLLRLVLVDGPP